MHRYLECHVEQPENLNYLRMNEKNDNILLFHVVFAIENMDLIRYKPVHLLPHHHHHWVLDVYSNHCSLFHLHHHHPFPEYEKEKISMNKFLSCKYSIDQCQIFIIPRLRQSVLFQDSLINVNILTKCSSGRISSVSASFYSRRKYIEKSRTMSLLCFFFFITPRNISAIVREIIYRNWIRFPDRYIEDR